MSSMASSIPNPIPVACDLGRTPGWTLRQLVRRLLDGQDSVLVHDAVLVADELVTNAHQHGRAPRACRLALVGRGHCLRIEVDDAAPEIPDGTGGRGLVLVARLSDAWGVHRDRDHKTVWAELSLNHKGRTVPTWPCAN